MKHPTSNADVWVVDQGQVLLMRLRDQDWFEEQRIPFDEFTGSAIALSSFSLPESQVYLNVSRDEKNDRLVSGECWAGVGVDPIRVIQAPVDRLHQRTLVALTTMGATAQVICTSKPTQFSKATPMTLLNSQEFKHLERFISDSKSGSHIFPITLILYAMLWLKPGGQYQRMRLLSVICVLTAFFTMDWHAARHQPQNEIDTLQRFQTVLKTTDTPAIPVPFSDWAVQIRKFGQAERANITSIKVSWNEQALISTKVDLERDRKRVPKACSLINPKQAECSTSGSSQ